MWYILIAIIIFIILLIIVYNLINNHKELVNIKRITDNHKIGSNVIFLVKSRDHPTIVKKGILLGYYDECAIIEVQSGEDCIIPVKDLV